jgi:hypothetical protein
MQPQHIVAGDLHKTTQANQSARYALAAPV